jgi:hypothetical protein
MREPVSQLGIQGHRACIFKILTYRAKPLELADHLATNMDLDTKLATMEADGLPLYLPSQQVLAPGHRHTDGSGKGAGATSTSPHNPKALPLTQAPTQEGAAVQGNLLP